MYIYIYTCICLCICICVRMATEVSGQSCLVLNSNADFQLFFITP